MKENPMDITSPQVKAQTKVSEPQPEVFQGEESAYIIGNKIENSTAVTPSSAREHFRRALDYKMQKDYEKAIVEYNKAIELDSNFDMAYYSRAELFQLEGRNADAIADFERVIALSQNTELITLAKHHIQELGK